MQLNTFNAPSYPPFSIFSDQSDCGFEISTARKGTIDSFFVADEYKNSVVRQLDNVKQQILEPLSTYFSAAPFDTDEQIISVRISAEAIIDTAKQVTGLSIKDLAGIFQVTRQTLYNFRHSEDKITERNWLRLQAVNREIESISTLFTSSPGSLMKRVIVDGVTLYDLLCADVLNTVKIEQLATCLAKQLKAPAEANIRHVATIDQLTRHG